MLSCLILEYSKLLKYYMPGVSGKLTAGQLVIGIPALDGAHGLHKLILMIFVISENFRIHNLLLESTI